MDIAQGKDLPARHIVKVAPSRMIVRKVRQGPHVVAVQQEIPVGNAEKEQCDGD